MKPNELKLGKTIYNNFQKDTYKFENTKLSHSIMISNQYSILSEILIILRPTRYPIVKKCTITHGQPCFHVCPQNYCDKFFIYMPPPNFQGKATPRNDDITFNLRDIILDTINLERQRVQKFLEILLFGSLPAFNFSGFKQRGLRCHCLSQETLHRQLQSATLNTYG